ncbi:MAG: LysM peptidoglycan-binding domain-containing protein [Spartobacteria bacterium]|nr:LysM peptidoglycan-binding domain-containing protein [Spartobacteria bacterium]
MLATMKNRKNIGKMSVLALLALCLAAGLTACGGAERLDRREEQDPVLKRAQARKRTHDIDGAIELFHKALERKPGLARAHLELGLIYDSEKEDYIRAIYHYQRYLELRPDAQKRPIIEDLINRARLSFVATLPNPPAGAIEEIAELKRENAMLQHRVVELQNSGRPSTQAAAQQESPRQTPVVTARSQEAPPATLVTPKPAPAQPAVQTYRVQEGDTLSRIASKMYNDNGQWQKIYEANKATMKNPGNLKVGQVLIIPQ